MWFYLYGVGYKVSGIRVSEYIEEGEKRFRVSFYDCINYVCDLVRKN